MRILQESVEGGEKFSGGGDEGDFEGFAGGAQAFIKGFENAVVANGVEGGHGASAAHRGTASGDLALAFARAAVVVEGGQAGQPSLSPLPGPDGFASDPVADATGSFPWSLRLRGKVRFSNVFGIRR